MSSSISLLPAAPKEARPLKIHKEDGSGPDCANVIGEADRSASSWPEAFAKQQELIQLELDKPDCDTDFWCSELVAVSDAADLYQAKVAKHDLVIETQLQMRSLVIQGIGDSVASRHPLANIAEFLRRDDPEAYLLW
jgi:hypothetical protein